MTVLLQWNVSNGHRNYIESAFLWDIQLRSILLFPWCKRKMKTKGSGGPFKSNRSHWWLTQITDSKLLTATLCVVSSGNPEPSGCLPLTARLHWLPVTTPKLSASWTPPHPTHPQTRLWYFLLSRLLRDSVHSRTGHTHETCIWTYFNQFFSTICTRIPIMT